MRKKENIIKFKEALKDIDFCYIDGRNVFDNDELNKINHLKIDLLFKQYFPNLNTKEAEK